MVTTAFAALWALAAYGGDNAAYGGDNAAYDADNSGDSGDVKSFSYDYEGYFGSDGCAEKLAAGQCIFCDDDGAMTDLSCEEIADDGECDASCNSANCSWDGMDCFHDDNGCFTELDGNDYRGTVSVNTDGKECAFWSDVKGSVKLDAAYVRSFGASSTWKPENYPDAGLGGHNYCRNPDHGVGKCTDGEDCKQPWCLHWLDEKQKKLGWAYCDVGEPRSSCPDKPSYAAAQPVPLAWGGSQTAGARASVREHKYNYYSLRVPAEYKGLFIVLVPTSLGEGPRLFADFDVPNPTGHNASYEVKASSGGVSELRMLRTQSGFCGKSPLGVLGECTLYLGVGAGEEDANYSLQIFDMAHPSDNICADKCDWSSLGDGDCDSQCDNEACFHDRGDCEGEKTGCPENCVPDYRGDGQRDNACFTLKCDWDGGDFGVTEGCADYCQPRMANNRECDPQCNVASCDFDGTDCFHGHNECYTRPNGYDYRGTVSHTKSGKQCQVWSDQTPNAHTMSARNWPSEGLGGHNFCRNPDQSEDSPWCYIAEPQLDEDNVPVITYEDNGDYAGAHNTNRFETCEVGPKSEVCLMPPPPPAQRMRQPSPSPPMTDVTTAPPGHCCNGCGSTLDYQEAGHCWHGDYGGCACEDCCACRPETCPAMCACPAAPAVTPAAAAAAPAAAPPASACCWLFNDQTKRYQFYPKPANAVCQVPYTLAVCPSVKSPPPPVSLPPWYRLEPRPPPSVQAGTVYAWRDGELVPSPRRPPRAPHRPPPSPPSPGRAATSPGRWLLVCGLVAAAVAAAGASIVALRRCGRLQQRGWVARAVEVAMHKQQGIRLEEDRAGATQTPGGDTPEGPEYEKKASTPRQPVPLRVIGITKKAAPVSTLEEQEGQPPPYGA